ncbi:MAG: hypothetical protein U0T79_01635 [Ferruginibacter sp.]
MNTTHIHLLLNHFPIVGTVIGSIMLIGAILRKSNPGRYTAAVILIAMAVIAIPVFLTGEPAEESVENLAGVSEQMIHLHEEAATIALWFMGITGLIALLALWLAWKKHRMANAMFVALFVLSALCFAAMARTGYYGGQIRHTEIRSAADRGLPGKTDGVKPEKTTEAEDDEKDKD